jgi:hypothetical protein
MKTASIADVSQEEFDSAVQLVISGIKASDPRLDTRLGTALRSLLVNPEARIEATTSKQIDYVRKSSSLKTLKEAEDAGESVDVDDVNAVMSNFNIKAATGTKAEGVVKILVNDGTKAYTVISGTEFKTYDGLEYASVADVVATFKGDADEEGYTGSVVANAPLYKGAAGYFFLVPVRAREVGVAYNIDQGTSMTVGVSLYSFIQAEAYKSFCGGSDVSDLQDAIDKIPSGLSIRGFVNKNACEGMLRDKFDDGQFPVVACSTVGYGNAAQRRDKHNVFGVGVGGRIDLYVRNFGDLFTITKVIQGKRKPVYVDGRLASMDYTLEVTPSDFPGSYWVKDVSLAGDVSSSLEFSCRRVAYGVDETWHDFDVRDGAAEVFDTVWHGLSVTVHETPEAAPQTESSGSTESSPDQDDEEWPEEREFRVSVYCLPQIREIQAYVDSDDVRSVATDVVVRCPIICNVSVTANVVYDVDNPMDHEYTKFKIREYINGLGFVKSLTRSEIVHIIKNCGAVSVDLSTQDMLYGILYDANGEEHRLTGDSLILDRIADDSAMLSRDTAIFGVEPENIQLTFIPNK